MSTSESETSTAPVWAPFPYSHDPDPPDVQGENTSPPDDCPDFTQDTEITNHVNSSTADSDDGDNSHGEEQTLPARRQCIFFPQGKCAKGDTCTYSHLPGSELATDFRRGPCKFFGEGKCLKGESCPFSHTVESSIPPDDSLRPCKFFSQGRCSKGYLCIFRHDAMEVTLDPHNAIIRDPCKFFSEGRCNKGDACTFDHVPDDGHVFRASYEVTPKDCLFFPQGKCKNGNACAFRHVSAATTESPQGSSAMEGTPHDSAWLQGDDPSPWPSPAGEHTPIDVGSSTSIHQDATRHCKFYSQGRCKNGNGCAFRHDPSITQQQAPTDVFSWGREDDFGGQWPSSAGQSHGRCNFFDQGHCTKGTSCRFTHQVQTWSSEPFHDAAAPEEATTAQSRENDSSTWLQGGDNVSNSWPPQANGHTPIGAESSSRQVSSEYCKFYSQGQCKNGDDCGFRHDASFTQWGAESADDDGGWGKDSWDDDSNKQRPPSPAVQSYSRCKFYDQGHCTRGTSCRFTHQIQTWPSEPLHDTAAPDEVASAQSRENDSSTWLQGGDNDPNSWPPQENGHTPIGAESSSRQVSSEYCKFYSQGQCKNGDDCGFRHDASFTQWGAESADDDGGWGKDSWDDDSRQRPPSSAGESHGRCKFYDQGHCTKGSSCHFTHQVDTSSEPHLPHAVASEGVASTSAKSGGHDASDWGNDAWSGNDHRGMRTSARPVGTCKFFDSGHCTKGVQCRFVHASVHSQTSDELQHAKRSDGGSFGNDTWPGNDNHSEMRTSARPGTCKFFDSGHCTKGAQCRFVHPGVDGQTSESQHAERADCRSFSQGACNWGDACKFRHAVEDLSFTGWGLDPSADDGSTWGKNSWLDDDAGSQPGPSGDSQIEKEKTSDPERYNQDASPAPPPDHADSWSSESFSKNDPPPHPETPIDETPVEAPSDDESIWGKDSWPEADNDNGRATPMPNPTIRICKFFQQYQHCRNGDSCSFLHLRSDMEAVHDGASSRDDLPTRNNTGASRPIRRFTETEDMTVEQPMFGCTVQFRKAATVQKVTTAFESCQILLSNLPEDVTEANVADLTKPFGDTTMILIEEPRVARPSAYVNYAQCAHASRAVCSLNGTDYRSSKLNARLNIRTVEIGAGNVLSRKVKISWSAPTLIAWAHYKTITVAKRQTVLLNGKVFNNGRKITASFLRPRKTQTHSFSVELRLPLGSESADILTFCTEATGVTLGSPTYDLQSCTDHIRDILRRFGPVDSFDVLPHDNTKIKIIAFAQFTTAEAAVMAAKDVHGSKPEFLNGNTIGVEQIHWIKYIIPSLHFKTIKANLDGLHQAHDKVAKIRYHDRDSQGLHLDPACIHIYATDPKALSRLKIALESLLSGEPLVSNGKGIWDEYFGTREGGYFIRMLNAESGFFVKCDTRMRTLRFCGTGKPLDHVHELITRQLGDVYARRHVIPLRKGLVRPLVSGGLNELQGNIGLRKVTLDVVTPSLTVQGDSSDVKRVQRALDTMDFPSGRAKVRNADVLCPVCACEATDVDAVALSCGHVYCIPCLQHFLRSAAGPNFLSPRCVAENHKDGLDKTTCDADITLDVIRDMLSSLEEKSLLESSFSSYIRGQPGNFRHCPTPECQVVYRPSDCGTVLQCPSCPSRICPACHVDFHEGLTCAEYQDTLTVHHHS